MEHCKLCLKNKADNKGSHIVPHFLLKRIENLEGKTKRDYEVGFTISESNAKSHFGRSVPTVKLSEIYGEITDEDLRQNIHPLVVDFYFCTNCEIRLSVIESEYAKTMQNVGEGNYESGATGAVGLLFWISVFWRMSIHGKSGIRFQDFQEKSLRGFLDENLKLNRTELSKLPDFEYCKQGFVSYKILRCSSFSREASTFLVLHPEFDRPYSLLIDEFVVCIAFDGAFDDFQTKDFFTINDLIELAPVNLGVGVEVVFGINSERFAQIGFAVVNSLKETKLAYFNSLLDQLHVYLGRSGASMPLRIKAKIFEEMAKDETKLGRKYTQDEFIRSTMSVLEKHAKENGLIED